MSLRQVHVPHFTGKAKVDRIVKEAGFANHTFVVAPFYYQNLIGVLCKNRLTDPRAGLSRLIQQCGAFTWGTLRNLATSLPERSLTPTRAGHGE